MWFFCRPHGKINLDEVLQICETSLRRKVNLKFRPFFKSHPFKIP